jgi:hypothetical protein
MISEVVKGTKALFFIFDQHHALLITMDKEETLGFAEWSSK